ncbi:lysoplasmalogenase family protein [Brachybacterium sp. DNPG3]
MPSSRTVHTTLWVAYALTALIHVGAIVGGADLLRNSSQTLFAPLLLGILLTAAPRITRSVALLSAGLVCSFIGDTAGQITGANGAQAVTVLSFLVTLACYAAAMLPVWLRRRDPMRMALAIPYGAVVIGLFVACRDGAAGMLPLVALYAVVLASAAFLAAGINTLTWTGGTLFLLSSSVLAIEWFLPGAALSFSALLVMITYVSAQALLIAGMVRAMPRHRWSAHRPVSSLVIVEG